MQTHPVPPHFDAAKTGTLWRVPYQQLGAQARQWAQTRGIAPAAEDRYRILLLLIDMQNTFCLPDFELFVGGQSGSGAVDDTRRVCRFIYRNIGSITRIALTMDTHYALQVFHAPFLIDAQGNNPRPMTQISTEEIESGRWKFNPAIAPSLGVTPEYGQRQLLAYTKALKQQGKYALTVWPYHAMLGGAGHALVPAIEEAVFFHTICRYSQPHIEIKGQQPFTEHYSVFGPEVSRDYAGNPLGTKNTAFFDFLLGYDAVLIAGEAKSHCVAASVSDLLDEIRKRDETLAQKIYLLEDCTSPVVVPGVADYSDTADEAFRRFAQAGMHLVRSTEPLESWLQR